MLNSSPERLPAAFLLFLVCLADQLVAWMIPLFGPPGASLAGIDPVMVRFLPSIVTIGMFLIFAALGTKLATNVRPVILFAMGSILAAAGQLLSCFSGTLAMFLLARAISAAGTAVLLVACGKSWSAGDRNTTPPAVSAAAGVASGTALGALLAVYLGPESVFYGSILVLVLILSLGPRRAQSVGGAPVTGPLLVLASASIVALVATGSDWVGTALLELVAVCVVAYGLALFAMIWTLHHLRNRSSALP